MNLFIFFALPLATILLAIVLQKILKSPILVAITFFAIYLIVAFAAFSNTLAEAIIAAIIYTLIAYITAYIAMLICRCRRRVCSNGLSLTNNALSGTTLRNYSCEENDINNSTTIDIANEATNFSGVNSVIDNQYVNDNMTYGNIISNRNNMQRRCYRR